MGGQGDKTDQSINNNQLVNVELSKPGFSVDLLIY